MDWLEASKVSYYKNDEVPKIIDDINQRTNSQMRCCRRELVCLFYDFIWNSPSCYWDNNVCTQFSGRLTAIASQHPDIIISESMIEHFLSACSTYSQITSIINDLDSINENDSIKNRLYRIPTYTSIVEGCLTNLFRFIVLLIDQFSAQDYSAQRKLEPLRTVLIKNGFSNGIESVDVKIRNSINHGGVIFREDGRVIEFHYMENSKSLSKELTVYEFDDLINRMYDITSAALLSVCLFLNEHWDKISVNMSQKTFVSFALLSMKLSIPSIRCRFISDTSNSKQLNADFYTVKTDRAFIVETALILHIQPDFSILQKICINNFCSESSQAYRQDELSLHCAYTFSLNTTSSGSAQSAVSGGWNVNDTQKTVSVFENGDGLFVGKQFLCNSLQLAQVAVDGGLRGAQLGGHLADGTLHIKDARVVQRLHDADLLFHRQPVGRQPGAAGHLGNGILHGIGQGTDKVLHPDAGRGGLGVRPAEGKQLLRDAAVLTGIKVDAEHADELAVILDEHGGGAQTPLGL